MRLAAACLLCAAAAAGCKSKATTLAIDVAAAPGVTVRALTLHLDLGGADAGVAEALPPSGAMPSLPGRAVVRLPDEAIDIAVALDGEAADGTPLSAATTTRSVPHEEVVVALTLGAFAPDLGDADLAAPVDEGEPCAIGARCSYAHRRQLTIHNGSAAALPAGYTVRVPINTTVIAAGAARADLADVRLFVDAPGGERPRVIDLAPPGQARALWLALAQPIAAGASDSSYSLYYGNAAATTPPADPAQVFAFWDGFDNGAQLAAHWLSNGGPTVGGGTITFHKNGQDAVTTVPASDGVDTLSVVEWRSKLTDPASAGQVVGTDTFWSWVGYQRDGDFTPADPWMVWIVRGPTDLHAERKIPTSATCMAEGACNGPSVTPDATYHVFRIERDAAATRYYLDGALSYAIDDPNNQDHSLMMRNYAVTSDLVVDWIRARSLASPEPAVIVGPETTP